MGWVRVDDHFNEHPKLARVGPLGWGIWVAGLAYCNRNLTDGFIPRGAAISLGSFELELDGDYYDLAVTSGSGGTDITADWVINLLLGAGLWEPVEGGYQVHDYHDFQPSKDRVMAGREAKTARQQRWRNGRVDGDVDASTDASVDASVDGGVEHAPKPKPKPSATQIKTTSLRSDVLECFAYWQERCNHKTAKLGSDRRAKIEARLREGYTVHDIRRAIDGAAQGAFVSDNGKRFDDIELICRNGSKLEGFMERAGATARVVPITRAPHLERMDAWKRGYPEEQSG